MKDSLRRPSKTSLAEWAVPSLPQRKNPLTSFWRVPFTLILDIFHNHHNCWLWKKAKCKVFQLFTQSARFYTQFCHKTVFVADLCGCVKNDKYQVWLLHSMLNSHPVQWRSQPEGPPNWRLPFKNDTWYSDFDLWCMIRDEMQRVRGFQLDVSLMKKLFIYFTDVLTQFIHSI